MQFFKQLINKLDFLILSDYLLVNLAILISGRGSNMRAILRSIKIGEIRKVDNIIVVSNKLDAAGLKIAAEEFDIKTLTITKDNNNKTEFERKLISILQNNNIFYDNALICLAGFMQILSPTFVKLYENRIMNIHPSLLPSFRGLHAQKQAIDAGVKVSGCTVHFVNNTMDGGPIILQQCVPVYDNDDEISLAERILLEEHKSYVKAIKLFTSKKIFIKDNRVFQN